MHITAKQPTPLLLLLFLISLQAARAYYDPSSQTWINRDPAGEAAGANLTRFVANNPISRADKFGYRPIAVPPMPPLGDPGAIAAACRCAAMISDAMYAAEAYANSTVGAIGAMHSNAGSPADMLTHCIGACEVAKGEAACKGSGYDPRKYLQDSEPRHATEPEDMMDYENNKIGFSIADRGGDCRRGCEQAFVDGRLWTTDRNPPHRAHPSGPPATPAPPQPSPPSP